jgi:hypothetical protein
MQGVKRGKQSSNEGGQKEIGSNLGRKKPSRFERDGRTIMES